MAGVTRLLTSVDLDDADDDGPDAQRMSVKARHEAVLEDGRRVLLLDGRGWTAQLAGGPEPLPSIWALETAEDLEQSAREVVGPDEPFGDMTQAEMEASHWDHLADVLREQGVESDPAALARSPHDVALSPRLRARVSGTCHRAC